MNYELYYSTGGHGGPYYSIFAAKLAALTALSGDKTVSYIDVKSRSINSEVVAQITRDDYNMIADELGQVKLLKETTKINMAQFEVKATVTLYDVDDAELQNSKVLHPDVLAKLQRNFDAFDFEITLDEVFLIDKIK